MIHGRFTFPSAVHLFLICNGRILLLRRFNTGYEDGNYSVVAGHLNGGEEVRAAAIREAREEVGIDIAPEDVEVVGVMHRMSNDERIDWFVAIHRWTGEIRNAEPDKCDDLAWFAPEQIPPNVIPYVQRAIENWLRSVWFDSYGWP
jgi:8-oxo-dGTP diphosphatase